MRVTTPALGLALACSLLCACQGAQLPAANMRPSVRTAEAAPLSAAARLAQPFLTEPGEGASNPYRQPVNAAALADVERAIVLRQRARTPRQTAPPHSASLRARTMPAPDINGDQHRGGVDLGRLLGAIVKLIQTGRVR